MQFGSPGYQFVTRGRKRAVPVAFLAAIAVGLLTISIAALAAGANVTVQTDQSSYYGAQSLTVFGTVTPTPTSGGIYIVISVKGPTGSVVLFNEGPVSQTNGTFSVHFVTGGPNWVAGTYTVNATYVPPSGPSGWGTATFSYSITAATTTTSATPTSSTTTTSATSTIASTPSTTQTSSIAATNSTTSTQSPTTTTQSSTPTTTAQSTAVSPTTTASSSGIPEFPFQLTIALVFTAVIAAAYAAARSKATR